MGQKWPNSMDPSPWQPSARVELPTPYLLVLYQDPPMDDEDEDSEDYWSNIYYEGDDKERAQEIIRNIGEDGVYLVRTGADGGQVLVVFAENMPKKYKITNENGEFYLKKEGPHCDSVEMLMYTYYSTELPTAKSCLETPYKLHSKYKG